MRRSDANHIKYYTWLLSAAQFWRTAQLLHNYCTKPYQVIVHVSFKDKITLLLPLKVLFPKTIITLNFSQISQLVLFTKYQVMTRTNKRTQVPSMVKFLSIKAGSTNMYHSDDHITDEISWQRI
jgi:hypothetical protein